MSLNCVTEACGNDVYEINGYSRWSFFEYLAERFGNNVLKDVFVAGAALGSPPPETALASALTAKGTNLSDVYSDYTTHVLAGNFQAGGAQGAPAHRLLHLRDRDEDAGARRRARRGEPPGGSLSRVHPRHGR